MELLSSRQSILTLWAVIALIIGIVIGGITAFDMGNLFLILIVGIFVLSIIKPKICFLFLVLLTPWSPAMIGMMVNVSENIIGLPITIFELLAAAAWIAILLNIKKIRNVNLPKISLIHLILLLWLIISALVGVARGTDVLRLLRNVIVFSSFFPFSVLMSSGLLVLSTKERVYYQILVLGTGLGALFFLSPLMGYHYGGVALTSQIRINRIDWWFNTFVFVYILCTILGEKRLNTFLKMFLVTSTIISIILSLGRSFWLAAFGVIIYVSVTHFKRNKWMILFTSVVLGISLLLFSDVMEQRFILGEDSLQHRFNEHSVILSEAFNDGFFNSIIGRGLAAPIPEELARRFTASYVWWIHNEWLLLLYNSGLIGLLLYGLFLFTLLGGMKNCLGGRLAGLALLITSIGAGQVLSNISGPWIAFATYTFFTNDSISKKLSETLQR